MGETLYRKNFKKKYKTTDFRDLRDLNHKRKREIPLICSPPKKKTKRETDLSDLSEINRTDNTALASDKSDKSVSLKNFRFFRAFYGRGLTSPPSFHYEYTHLVRREHYGGWYHQSYAICR